MRQRLLSSLVVAGLMTGAHALALAQGAASFPNKPINIIVPFPAGGTADVLPRIVGQKLSEKWGQPVIIENRSGAGGNIGAQAVAKAAPDGYTLLATPPAPLSINQNLYKNLGYEPERFVPITVLAAVPNVLAVRSTLPVSNVKEFIAYAKKENGNVTAATQGNGTTSHLTATMFSTQAGVKFTFVPYKGTAPALGDLMGGQVDAFFDNISSSYRQHEAGKVKILAVASSTRSPLLPNVPTIAETGLPQFNSSTWFAVVAPPGTPDDVAQKLNSAIVEVLNMKDVRQKFLDQGAEVVGNTPKQMNEFVANERTRWKKVIDSAGVTMN
ncbi:MAG: tripartite tricarboxylate transporter substrate binding protein [Noviherbaspirillum sp.]|nr:tripartite tricarboxylate transporter substrate binding protein [Noviherbaspirillum sp.]